MFLDPLGLPLGFGSVWGGVLNSSGELANHQKSVVRLAKKMAMETA